MRKRYTHSDIRRVLKKHAEDLGRGARNYLRSLLLVPERKIPHSLPSRIAVATAITARMKARGWNQGDVVRRAKIRQSRVSEVLCLKGNPTLSTLDAILRVLQLQVGMGPAR